jgi:hypothetical protein
MENTMKKQRPGDGNIGEKVTLKWTLGKQVLAT